MQKIGRMENQTEKIPTPIELFGVECGKGWHDLIIPIIEYVNKFNEEHHLGDGEKIEFLQIKEKWGGLRIYTNYGTKELHEMIDKAEEESYNVCENCGLRTDVGLKIDGWHMTLCKYCATNLAMERKYPVVWCSNDTGKTYTIDSDGTDTLLESLEKV